VLYFASPESERIRYFRDTQRKATLILNKNKNGFQKFEISAKYSTFLHCNANQYKTVGIR
jgi:hypothetical protein